MRAVIAGRRWDAAKHGLRVPAHDAEDRGVPDVVSLCVLWVGPSAAPAGVQPAALAPAPAPEPNVAAVETVSGHVVAFARGKPALLQNDDIISDHTELDLKPNSELRICHYRANRLLRLRGPARASVSADGLLYEGGRAVNVPAARGLQVGRCRLPASGRASTSRRAPQLRLRRFFTNSDGVLAALNRRRGLAHPPAGPKLAPFLTQQSAPRPELLRDVAGTRRATAALCIE
jgi:hypothetical protein